MLAAFGVPEPVRYESNTTAHNHFRCRVCLRLFDFDGLTAVASSISQRGFLVERVETRAEGVCADCTDYQAGLRTAAQAILTTPPLGDSLHMRGTAVIEINTPLGPLLLAATQRGMIRLAFPEHADARELRDLASNRRGSEAARRHLDQATRELAHYLTGDSRHLDCTIDWATLADHAPDVLQSTLEIPYGTTRSYTDMKVDRRARKLGESLGANPVAILTPCHRVMRGVETPEIFVGGAQRRTWLVAIERRTAST